MKRISILSSDASSCDKDDKGKDDNGEFSREEARKEEEEEARKKLCESGAIVVVHVISGGGDIEHGKEAVYRLKVTNPEISNIYVIAVVKDSKLQKTPGSEKELEKKFREKGATAFSCIPCRPEEEADLLFKEINAISIRGAYGMLLFAPGGHHYLKTVTRQGSELPPVENFRQLLDNLLTLEHLDIFHSIILQTEFGRDSEIKDILPQSFSKSWKDDRFVVEQLGECKYNIPEGFRKFWYLRISKEGMVSTVNVSLYTPHFSVAPGEAGFDMSANLPMLSLRKHDLLMEKRTDKISAPTSINIFFYCSAKKINVRYEEILAALQDEKLLGFLLNAKIFYVNMHIVGYWNCKKALIAEKSNNGDSIEVYVTHSKKLEQDEFLSRAFMADLLFMTGDSSIIEAIYAKYRGVLCYTAGNHKKTIAENANRLIEQLVGDISGCEALGRLVRFVFYYKIYRRIKAGSSVFRGQKDLLSGDIWNDCCRYEKGALLLSKLIRDESAPTAQKNKDRQTKQFSVFSQEDIIDASIDGTFEETSAKTCS